MLASSVTLPLARDSDEHWVNSALGCLCHHPKGLGPSVQVSPCVRDSPSQVFTSALGKHLGPFTSDFCLFFFLIIKEILKL